MIDPRKRTQKDGGAIFASLYPARADGRCACGCEQALPKRRRRWFSEACVTKALHAFGCVKGDTTLIRAAVFERDKGRCADCGLETEAERSRLRSYAWAWNQRHYPPSTWNDPGVFKKPIPDHSALREEILNYMAEGFPSPHVTWWNADHILPVEFGGGGSTLSNFQTLCLACHKIKSREQARERSRRRKEGI